MNRQDFAEELDQEVDKLLCGSGETVFGRSGSDQLRSLLAVAAELQGMAEPEFRRRLRSDLLENASTQQTSEIPAELQQFENGIARPFSEAMPSFVGKSFGIYPADHRSFVASFASHTALVLLIASGIWVGQRTIKREGPVISALTFPVAGDGGGGSGNRSAVPVSKGTPPKFSDQQLAPPAIVVRNPMLAVEPTVLGPPNIKLPQSNQLGDLISSNTVMPSNGTGSGGGMGSNNGTGLGSGPGSGVGPGSDRGFGGGPYTAGGGVIAPRVIFKLDPEYSEEARKAKFQGNVTLSFVVDAEGHPRNIHVVRSLGMGLDERAIDAVKRWKFEPGMKDGIPVAVMVSVEVNFRLY
jgi:TonB family protein